MRSAWPVLVWLALLAATSLVGMSAGLAKNGSVNAAEGMMNTLPK
jgi:hypothetical protein